VADVDLEAFSRKDLLQRLGAGQPSLSMPSGWPLLALPCTVVVVFMSGSEGRPVLAQRPSLA
jgi:hypothetical protein